MFELYTRTRGLVWRETAVCFPKC